ncbi:MAG: FAD-dependent oxidoreductase [Pseudomonadota bacterium]
MASAAKIDRRTMLQLSAAGLLASCGAGESANGPLKVVVVGAGIVGASIAYFLAKNGAKVTIIDKEGPASHASKGTFAWINASWAKQPRDYHSLNQLGVSGWHYLEQDLAIPMRWSGAFEWFDSQARMATLERQIAQQQEWGEPAQMLSAANMAAREPALAAAFPAAFSPRDGAVDPVAATRMLVEGAQKFGAKLMVPAALADVEMEGETLRAAQLASGESIPADKLVLATGAAPNMAKTFAKSHVPQRSTAGIIAITYPMAPVIRHILAAPGIHLHQRIDGRVVLGEEAGPPQTQAHMQRLVGRPRRFLSADIEKEHAARLSAMASAVVPALGQAKIEQTIIGWRPLPLDGHPVIGISPQRPDVYLAITHSGVTLAPAIGQLAAYELLEARAISRLEPYRPGRTFAEVFRY